MVQNRCSVDGYAWESKVPLTPNEGEHPTEMIERLKTSGDVLEHHRYVKFNYEIVLNRGLMSWETVESYIATFRDEVTYPYIMISVSLTKLD